MDTLSSIAAAGMRTRLEALDLLSNNIANTSTQGFKSDWEAYTLYASAAETWEDAHVGQESPALPEIDKNRTDFSQGQIVTTDSEADLALNGAGFFQVAGANGGFLTRKGRISVSESGRLINQDGMEFTLLDPPGRQARYGIPVQVNADGAVTQDGTAVGQLKVVEPGDTGSLKRRDGVYFYLDADQATSLKPAAARVHQGAVEATNSSAADSGVKLISVLRQFEALQRALQIGTDLGRKAVEEVARVAP